jgi:2-oxoisovalerate dehydrogenase E1 component alpha subunit
MSPTPSTKSLSKKAKMKGATKAPVKAAGKGAAKKSGKTAAAGKDRALGLLPKQVVLQMLDMMVKSRVLEERLIKVYKTGDAFFWIGGPGEEAFGVPLGLLVDKGQGVSHDYLHLHYRGTPTLIAMGMTMIDSIRLIMNRSTDRSTGGRNFANHYCFPEWNVVPVGSPIEVQYGMAVGTAMAQRRRKMKKEAAGVSIVTGGDAGSAEGDFASCLIWSSRPGNELAGLHHGPKQQVGYLDKVRRSARREAGRRSR